MWLDDTVAWGEKAAMRCRADRQELAVAGEAGYQRVFSEAKIVVGWEKDLFSTSVALDQAMAEAPEALLPGTTPLPSAEQRTEGRT